MDKRNFWGGQQRTKKRTETHANRVNLMIHHYNFMIFGLISSTANYYLFCVMMREFGFIPCHIFFAFAFHLIKNELALWYRVV